jgi:hypothetical protein
MVLYMLGFKNIEAIAPHSENTVLDEDIIKELKEKYTGICTMFDNDRAGIDSMLKYKKRYNISGAHLKVENDLADCVEVHGIRNTKEWLYPILSKALTGTLKELP